MAGADKKPYLAGYAAAAAVIGAFTAIFFEPLSAYLKALPFFIKFPGGYGDEAAQAAAGAAIFGAAAFVYFGFFSARMLQKLVSLIFEEMKKKQILPVSYIRRKSMRPDHAFGEAVKIIKVLLGILAEVSDDREKFCKAVERHLDPSVKEHLEGRSSDEVYLGGKKKTATVFFSDLRGFTAFTENNSAEEVVTVLNDYFTEATKIINRYHGRVNKYIGDAVLAVFDEPAKHREYLDCDQAIMAALDIQTSFGILLKRWKEKRGVDFSIGLGIGLARGIVTAGTVGSEERMEYTVIGDTVNLASRLCSKAPAGQVIISDDIYSLMERDLVVEELSAAELKGKSGRYRIYSVKTRKMVV